MWEQYKKHLIATQIFIFLVCGLLYFSGRGTLPQVLLAFIAMQIGSFVGAWWGARLKSKIERSNNKLPLERR